MSAKIYLLLILVFLSLAVMSFISYLHFSAKQPSPPPPVEYQSVTVQTIPSDWQKDSLETLHFFKPSSWSDEDVPTSSPNILLKNHLKLVSSDNQTQWQISRWQLTSTDSQIIDYFYPNLTLVSISDIYPSNIKTKEIIFKGDSLYRLYIIRLNHQVYALTSDYCRQSLADECRQFLSSLSLTN